MARLGNGRSGIRISAGVGDLFSKTVHTGTLAPLGLQFIGYRASFPGQKRPGHEVYNSVPSSTEVKNGWSCTCTLLHALMAWAGTFFCLNAICWNFFLFHFVNENSTP